MEQHFLIVVLLTFSYMSFTRSGDPSDDNEYEFRNNDYCANGAGLTCDPTCKLLGNCIQLGTTIGWVLVQKCPDESFCDSLSLSCISGDNCPVSTGNIMCNEQGQFPNPYNCTGYFFCSNNGNNVYVTCENDGELYNACTESCESQVSADCHRTKPVCKTAGQFGVIQDNERYFYYCFQNENNEILPSILKCDEGHVFSINLNRCISSDNECTSESGTITTQTPINCLYTGQRFPHSDCRKFNECDEDLQLTVITCTSGSHYDPVSTNCVYGTCS